MGDVLMIKNDSGIKSATGLTGSGSRDWIIQRISAVVLVVYSVVLLGFFLTHGDVTFVEWSSFWGNFHFFDPINVFEDFHCMLECNYVRNKFVSVLNFYQ